MGKALRLSKIKKTGAPCRIDYMFNDIHAKRYEFKKQFAALQMTLDAPAFEKGFKTLVKSHARFYGLNNKYRGDGSRR